jgi:hypothetical protein
MLREDSSSPSSLGAVDTTPTSRISDTDRMHWRVEGPPADGTDRPIRWAVSPNSARVMDRGQLACRTTLGVETVSSSQPDRSKDPLAGSITDADREGSTKRAIMNVTVRRFEGGEWSVFTIECVDLSEDRVAQSKAQALTDQRAPDRGHCADVLARARRIPAPTGSRFDVTLRDRRQWLSSGPFRRS